MPYTPMQLAEAFIQTGELKDAVEALNEHLREHPIDRNAKRLLASILFRMRGQHNLEAAQQLLEGLKTADDYIMLGLIEEQISEDLPAISEFQQAWKINPRDERVAEMYIERLLQSGEERFFGEAMSVVLHLPRTWRWLQSAGDISVLLVANSWAVMYYDHAMADLERQFDTQNNAFSANLKANLLLKRANAYLNLKELDAAESDYKLAETIVPGDSTIPFQRGLVAYLRGDLNEAVRLCKAGLNTATITLRHHLIDILLQPQYAPLAALLDMPTP